MNNKLQIFNHEDFGEVRTVYNNENDEVWFVGKDIAKKLGYHSYQNMFKIIDNEDKVEVNPQSESYQGLGHNGITLEPNPNIYRMVLINESGLYNAIFGSQLPQAKEFKRWVTSEVLPSIRKHGGYIAGQEEMSPELLLANALKLADNIIKEKDLAIREKQAENLELKGMNLELEGEIFEQMPKVSAWDSYLNDGNNISISDLAKMLAIKDLGRNNMFKLLREKNILIGKTTEPYQEYINRGYFKLKAIEHEHANSVTLVTPKGMEWLKKKLVEWGYAFH